MVKRYAKNPIVVEAIQFRENDNNMACRDFLDGHYNGRVKYPNIMNSDDLTIRVNPGDYVIKRSDSDFYYRASANVFEQDYVEIK